MAARRAKRRKVNRWQQRVTRNAQSLELEPGLFTRDDPKHIARSLLRAAARSKRKTAPFRSAMSVLVFYINRSGRKLAKSRRATLERAKVELRALAEGESRHVAK